MHNRRRKSNAQTHKLSHAYQPKENELRIGKLTEGMFVSCLKRERKLVKIFDNILK